MKQAFQRNRLWRDKDGRQAVVQTPNAPLIAWMVSFVLSKALPYGQANFAASLVAFGSLFTWAWLELFQGSSYLRRATGLLVLIWAIAGRL